MKTEEKKLDGKKDFRAKGDKRFKDRKKGLSDKKSDKDFMDKPYKRGPNDPSWRTNDEVMTKLVATIPFGVPAGLPQLSINSAGVHQSQSYSQAGIMSIHTLLTAGQGVDYNSPLNLCFRKIYSYVRHANSGSRNYEAADMGNYFIAVGQVLGLLGYLQRVLRTISEFSSTNRYTPRALLKVMGVDADAMLSSIPQLKYLIAWLGRAIGSLAFPDLPYFHACYEAFKYVYRDNDSPKEQLYVLCPYEFGQYNPTYDANGGGVNFDRTTLQTIMNLPDGAFPKDYVNIQAYVKDRIDVLLGDEDIGIISGDILKAFPNGTGLFKPEPFGLEYDLFMHSPEILQQIHNLTVIRPDYFNFKGYHQDPGSTGTAPFIIHDIAVPTTGWGNHDRDMCSNLIIDAFSREPDPKEVVNCTVLNPQVFVTTVGTNDYSYSDHYVFFDLFLPQTVYVVEDVMAATPKDQAGKFTKCGQRLVTSQYNAADISAITSFDWHPLIWFVDNGTDKAYPIGDVQNLRIISDWTVAERIHENSMLGLLAFKEHNFY